MRNIKIAFGMFAYVVAVTAGFMFLDKAANAHTMNVTECHTFAWDAKQEAFDRPVATQKMQLAVMASTLEMCRERGPITCIYQDDQDDAQAINTLNWVYEKSDLTPQQIHDQVERDCNDRLMESLGQVHGQQ